MMTEQQFKKINFWFKKLNQKIDKSKEEINYKIDFKFERVYRQFDELKVRSGRTSELGFV